MPSPFATGRVMRSLLYAIDPPNPPVLGIVTGVLGAGARVAGTGASMQGQSRVSKLAQLNFHD
ncbi:MAG: hypothetical protein M3O15_13480 [Acidobacteriota bacterium]|nr:hypothetical protein [Acidobacteriota bacterium]